MPLRWRTVTVLVALVVLSVVAFPSPAQACQLLNNLLVGCAPTPGPEPPPPLISGIDGVITLPTVPGPVPPPPAPAPAPPPPPGAGVVVLLPDAARQLLGRANQERAATGARAVVARDDVTRRAEAHSLDMARRGSIWHDASFVTRTTASLLGATQIMGENVAWSTDLDDAHRRLMASPGHRTNLLDPRYSVAGFAVARSVDGKYYVTQQFLQRAGPAPASAAAAAAPPPGTPAGLSPGPTTTPPPAGAPVPGSAAGATQVPGATTPAHDLPALSLAGTATRPGRADGAVLATEVPAPAPTRRRAAAATALALVVAVVAGHGWRVSRPHSLAAAGPR